MFDSFDTWRLLRYEFDCLRYYVTFNDSSRWYNSFSIYIYWSNIPYWMLLAGLNYIPLDTNLPESTNYPSIILFYCRVGVWWRWKFNNIIAMWVFIICINGTSWPNLDIFICVIYQIIKLVFGIFHKKTKSIKQKRIFYTFFFRYCYISEIATKKQNKIQFWDIIRRWIIISKVDIIFYMPCSLILVRKIGYNSFI